MFREFRLIIIPLALFLKAVISPPLPVIAGSLAMPRDMLFGRSGYKQVWRWFEQLEFNIQTGLRSLMAQMLLRTRITVLSLVLTDDSLVLYVVSEVNRGCPNVLDGTVLNSVGGWLGGGSPRKNSHRSKTWCRHSDSQVGENYPRSCRKK